MKPVTLSIANRILLGFLVLLAIMVGLGVYALSQISEVRTSNETIVSRDIGVMRQIAGVREDQRLLADARIEALIGTLRATPENRSYEAVDGALADWERLLESLEARIVDAVAMAEEYRVAATSPARREAWRVTIARTEAALAAVRAFRAESGAEIVAVRAGDDEAVVAAHAAVTESARTLDPALAAVEEAIGSVIAEGQQRVAEVYEQSRRAIALVVAGSVLLGVLLAFLIRRSIVRPLARFTAFVERAGRGDLAGEPAAVGRDEIGRLGSTLNGMVGGLGELARRSRAATENLNAAAAEIRASAQQQAASVEEQLAAVQETAATVDEITHSGTQIGRRAQEVIAAAQATVQTSQSGLQAVEETSRSMEAIREQAEAVAENIIALSGKTQAIGDVISTVNDISERSHLLALNAAIEAAAAGDAGRSFAVVAAEMKSLADQAKEATNQVRSILGDIQRGINASVMLTEEAVKRTAAGRERSGVTQRVIHEITGRIVESVQTFQQIVASTNQQQLGIEQVMSALQNIRQASQQTAAGTRQLEAAAGNLGTLSEQLMTLSERYRL